MSDRSNLYLVITLTYSSNWLKTITITNLILIHKKSYSKYHKSWIGCMEASRCLYCWRFFTVFTICPSLFCLPLHSKVGTLFYFITRVTAKRALGCPCILTYYRATITIKFMTQPSTRQRWKLPLKVMLWWNKFYSKKNNKV